MLRSENNDYILFTLKLILYEKALPLIMFLVLLCHAPIWAQPKPGDKEQDSPSGS